MGESSISGLIHRFLDSSPCGEPSLVNLRSLQRFKLSESAEGAALNASKKLGKKIGKIAATNLDELCLKARYADVWDEIGDSIIDDLLALDHKPKASASKEAKSKKANMLASPSGRHHKPGGGGTQAGI